MTKNEVMQMALETLEQITPDWRTSIDKSKQLNNSIEALRAALAQPDVPETAFGDKKIIQIALKNGAWETDTGELVTDDLNIMEFDRALRAALAQPESVAIAELNQTWTQDHWTEYERGIAAAEREACAQVCEANGHPDPTRIDQAKICASAIRARGQA